MLVEFFKLFIFIHSGHLLFRTLLTHCEPLYLLIRYKTVKSCTVFLSSIYAFHTFISAIGQHDERSGIAFDPISAALILADKSDVRRDRVRNTVPETFDKHDRVNYAALSSKLHVNTHKKVITLNIELDESICSMIDYFEIFSQRMLMCKRAAEVLGLRFKLVANGNKIA